MKAGSKLVGVGVRMGLRVMGEKRGGGFGMYSVVEKVRMRLGGSRLGCQKKIEERKNRGEGED